MRGAILAGDGTAEERGWDEEANRQLAAYVDRLDRSSRATQLEELQDRIRTLASSPKQRQLPLPGGGRAGGPTGGDGPVGSEEDAAGSSLLERLRGEVAALLAGGEEAEVDYFARARELGGGEGRVGGKGPWQCRRRLQASPGLTDSRLKVSCHFNAD